MRKQNFWKLETINEAVPIEDALAYLGIYPDAHGKYRLRSEERTPSASVHKDKKYGNGIKDFGSGNWFTPVRLVMYIRGCDVREATECLGEAFGIPPDEKASEPGQKRDGQIADYEWKLVGIYPKRVSMNMGLDAFRYREDSIRRLSEKFSMSMPELREMVVGSKRDEVHDYEVRRWYLRILRERVVPYASECRSAYFRSLNSLFRLASDDNSGIELSKIFSLYRDEHEKMAKELRRMEAVVAKLVKEANLVTQAKIEFKGPWPYNPAVDFEKVIRGEVSFEVAETRHQDVKSEADFNLSAVNYVPVTLAEYNELLTNGMGDAPVAAWQRGDSITLVFESAQSHLVNSLVKALRGREIAFARSLDEAREIALREKEDVQEGPKEKVAETPGGDAADGVKETEKASRTSGGKTDKETSQ